MSRSDRKRVVVTGLGAVTPLGIGVDTVWSRLLAGDNAVGPTTLFDASTFPTRISAEVDLGAVDARLNELGIEMPRSGRNARFGVLAAQEAWTDSGLTPETVLPARAGVYTGSGEGIMNFDSFVKCLGHSLTDQDIDVPAFIRQSIEQLDAMAELEQEPNRPAGHIARLLDLRGPNFNTLTACAASSQALGEATEMIRRGDVDVMVAGGCHSMIHPFGMTGFICLTALSTRNDSPETASRPFDVTRDGFVLGEGGAMLVLEEREHALARGAHVYGEILGYGASADAYRVTDQHPEGRGAVVCIERALADAGVSGEDIRYISAHGTSTTVNDKVETLAVKTVFGDRAYDIPVSSIKSMMGHLIAAAGAMEFITCLLAIRDGQLPPTINYNEPDPLCDLDYVPNTSRQAEVDVALSNSFGFGGQNVTLIASSADWRS